MEFIKIHRLRGTTLRLWDTYLTDSYGKSILRYEFKVGRKIIFEGSDFHSSPMHAIDSLECVYAVLNFLTLRPGDIDAEYFKSYNPAQLAWAESSACEYLACDVSMAQERLDRKRK
jgi:hypothetical protein